MWLVLFARWLITTGKTKNALSLLSRLLPAVEKGGRQRAAIEIMVVQAVAWWYVEDPLSDRELEVLQHAATQALERARTLKVLI